VSNAIATILEARKGGVWYVPAHVEPRSVQSAAKKAGYAFFHI
jgi:RNAse (barnase) inhibitor barstar